MIYVSGRSSRVEHIASQNCRPLDSGFQTAGLATALPFGGVGLATALPFGDRRSTYLPVERQLPTVVGPCFKGLKKQKENNNTSENTWQESKPTRPNRSMLLLSSIHRPKTRKRRTAYMTYVVRKLDTLRGDGSRLFCLGFC
jgi:hypothetical protein